MADPKYADLPGIAYDQPDVYETTDLPEADQLTDFYEDEENDSIEKLNISATEAFGKFKDKYLNAKKVDFSERLSRKIRTGYESRSGDWELVGQGEAETPLQKYQRLQCEIHELLDEINKLKDVAKESDQTPIPIVDQVEQADKLLQDLRLEETLGKDVVTYLANPEGTQLKKLFTLLEQFKQTPESSKPEPSKGAKGGETKSNAITYKLEYRPEQMKLVQSSRIGELEHRLHKLETVLGTTSDNLSRLSQITNQRSMLEAVQYLTAKNSTLDSTQLDHIEGRLIALTQKMNNISKQRTATNQDAELEQMASDLANAVKKNKSKALSSEDIEIQQMVSDLYEFVKKMNANSVPADVEKHQKVNSLYNFVKKIEPVVDLIPQTIQRLNALNDFHQQATEFNTSLLQLESLQSQLSAGVENNKALLQGVQESFAMNLDIINKNINSLSERINALKK